jgi:DDE superfamily endonuclease
MHKQPAVQAAIEAVGARLRFLPPYSPDFNPIELAFAKLKAFLRAARPRTFDQVVALVAIALRLFSPSAINFDAVEFENIREQLQTQRPRSEIAESTNSHCEFGGAARI